MTTAGTTTVNQITVTFDSNVIEDVLDGGDCICNAEGRINLALRQGVIHGFVSRTYFVHDAIKREDRINVLTDGIELWFPKSTCSNQQGVLPNVVKTSTMELDSFHAATLERMKELKMGVLVYCRKFWPELTMCLPEKHHLPTTMTEQKE